MVQHFRCKQTGDLQIPRAPCYGETTRTPHACTSMLPFVCILHRHVLGLRLCAEVIALCCAVLCSRYCYEAAVDTRRQFTCQYRSRITNKRKKWGTETKKEVRTAKKESKEMFALRAQNVMYVSPTRCSPRGQLGRKRAARNGRKYSQLKHVLPSRHPSGFALGSCGF